MSVFSTVSSIILFQFILWTKLKSYPSNGVLQKFGSIAGSPRSRISGHTGSPCGKYIPEANNLMLDGITRFVWLLFVMKVIINLYIYLLKKSSKNKNVLKVRSFWPILASPAMNPHCALSHTTAHWSNTAKVIVQWESYHLTSEWFWI